MKSTFKLASRLFYQTLLDEFFIHCYRKFRIEWSLIHTIIEIYPLKIHLSKDNFTITVWPKKRLNYDGKSLQLFSYFQINPSSKYHIFHQRIENITERNSREKFFFDPWGVRVRVSHPQATHPHLHTPNSIPWSFSKNDFAQ